MVAARAQVYTFVDLGGGEHPLMHEHVKLEDEAADVGYGSAVRAPLQNERLLRDWNLDAFLFLHSSQLK